MSEVLKAENCIFPFLSSGLSAVSIPLTYVCIAIQCVHGAIQQRLLAWLQNIRPANYVVIGCLQIAHLYLEDTKGQATASQCQPLNALVFIHCMKFHQFLQFLMELFHPHHCDNLGLYDEPRK